MEAHRPVLVGEVLRALAIRPAGLYVDATFGRGGHSAAILERLGESGRLIALDRDPSAVAAARRRFGDDARVSIYQQRFSRLGEVLDAAGARGRVDGVLLDIGVSSPQLDDPDRGFSFLRDGPLDMRMDSESGETAAEWLGRAPEREIARVLKEYGEERYHRRIARAIVAARADAAITRTAQLAAIVAAATPRPDPGKHPATRTFQALRVHLNAELEELRACLPQCVDELAPGGRLCVISFHSLEDRIVKRFMRDRSRVDPSLAKLPVVPVEAMPTLRLVGRAVDAAEAEVAENPRARSARLRVAERLEHGGGPR